MHAVFLILEILSSMKDTPARVSSEPKAESSIQTQDPHPDTEHQAQAPSIDNQTLTLIQDLATGQWNQTQPKAQVNN